MLPVGWLVAAVVVAVLLTTWITFTLTRLDRLHARVDAAQAALDAQLVRRAAALQHLAESPAVGLDPPDRRRYHDLAHAALDATETDPGRKSAENAVGRAVADLVATCDATDAAAAVELRETAARVLIARRFYNDAVRDTRALRVRRLPRTLRMAGRRSMPQFFDIDDTLPPPAVTRSPAASGAPADPPEGDPR